ncbi:MAG: hypothetical protein JST80_00020 [Bdellovibrionales bacterium]|nr:hypothetical protein [Bdellovibrionales bacterium]
MDRTLIALFVGFMVFSASFAFAQGASTGGGGDITRTQFCINETLRTYGHGSIYFTSSLINDCGFNACEADEIAKDPAPDLMSDETLAFHLGACIR